MCLNILIVDDEVDIRTFLARILKDHSPQTVEDGRKALALMEAGQDFDIIISDIKMPKMDGYELAERILTSNPDTLIILMTGFPDAEKAVKIVKSGVYDYLVKPFDLDLLEHKLEQLIQIATLRKRNRELELKNVDSGKFNSLIGNSKPMHQVFRLIDKASRRKDINVLITGETGTGKEVVARAVHDLSTVHGSSSFVPVNCGAMPKDLAESELFGHKKGSFTGAYVDKQGLFEEAYEGTLFLDEINSLPLEIQVKLNRAIEQKEGRRLGATQTYDIECRLIAASNEALKLEIEKGNFREDLFYRLNILEIHLPPLRERMDDLPLLIEHFLYQIDSDIKDVSSEAYECLNRHNWPGNIRELRNCLESATLLAEGKQIEKEDLPQSILDRGAPGDQKDHHSHCLLAELNYQEALETAKKMMLDKYLPELMKRFQGNVSKAAKHADIQRETLHRLLKKHGVNSADYRGCGSD